MSLSLPLKRTRTAAARTRANNLLLRLAWRDLWRQKRRTILLMVVVGYATLSIIFFWGFSDGFTQSIISNQARLLSAPVLISTPAYHNDPDPSHALKDLGFIKQLTSVRGVRAAAPRLDFYALLRSPYTSESAQVRGVVPGLEPKVSDLPKNVTQGRFLQKAGEVVLGESLAKTLDIRLGERMALDTSSQAGPQGMGLKLVGLIHSGVAAVDQGAVLVTLQDARQLTGVQRATGVALDVPHGQEVATAKRVQGVLPAGTSAYSVMALLGPISAKLEGSRVQMGVIGFFFALLAAFAVMSTVLVSVIERQREFGMMVAVGLTPPRLARMVMLEAVLTTLLGWLCGLLLGYALLWLFASFNILGNAFASISDAFAQFGMGREVYTTLSPSYALYASETIFLAAILALLVPARTVRRLEPTSAMRQG